LRRFYRLQLERATVPEDPTVRVRAPKKPRRLPKLLSEKQVEALLAAPASTARSACATARCWRPSTRRAARVRAGRLKIAQVSLDAGLVRVMGKGSKERLVPLGDEAVVWLQRYLATARPELAADAKGDCVFLTARRGR